jgi:tetratricopeptide (TPR) repeat protein
MKLGAILISVAVHAAAAQAPLEMAKSLYGDQKPAAARQILIAIKHGNKSYAEAQYYLGRLAFDEGKSETARTYFEAAIESDENIAEFYNWHGNALGRIAQRANVIKQGMISLKMKSAWEKAAALNARYLEPRQSLIQYYLQAPAFAGGSIEKAKAMADEIAKHNQAVGHQQHGRIFAKEGKSREAEREYQAMAKADSSLVLDLAVFYVSQQQATKEFALINQVLNKNPNQMVACYQYGRTAALTGQYLDKGEVSLKKYLAYNPKSGEPLHSSAYLRLAQIQEKRGNAIEAKRNYAHALHLDDNLKEAKEGLERVSGN